MAHSEQAGMTSSMPLGLSFIQQTHLGRRTRPLGLASMNLAASTRDMLTDFDTANRIQFPLVGEAHEVSIRILFG